MELSTQQTFESNRRPDPAGFFFRVFDVERLREGRREGGSAEISRNIGYVSRGHCMLVCGGVVPARGILFQLSLCMCSLLHRLPAGSVLALVDLVILTLFFRWCC